MRKFFTIFLVLAFAFSTSFSGVKEKKAKRVVDFPMTTEYSIPEAVKPMTKSFSMDGLQSFSTTDYDYGLNGGHIRNLVVNKAGDKAWIQVHERDGINNAAAPANRRAVQYAYIANSVIKTGYPVPKATAQTGFGGIDVTQGFAGGVVSVIVGHTPNWNATESGLGTATFTNAYFPATMRGTLDPQVSWDNSRQTIWVTSSATADRDNIELLKTTDFGATFTSVDTAMVTNKLTKKHYIAGAIHNKIEVAPYATGSTSKLAIFTALAGTGAIAPAGTAHVDSADQIGYFSSADGSTWTWTKVANDGDRIIIGSDTLYLFGENFAQYDFKYDRAGKLNAVINGYLYKRLTDTTGQNHFATLYWKEGVTGFKVVSDVASKYIAGYNSYGYPGNGFGFAYPTLSNGIDNDVVFAAWSQPSVTAGKIDTATGGIALMNIHWNVSLDGGATWKTAAKLANTTGGLFASGGAYLTPKGTNELVAHFVFMQDTAAGCYVFAEGNRALVPNVYARVSFDKTTGALTSVGDKNVAVKTFELEQNYPNPFNPSTTIRFNLPEASKVSLKVYNMMGQEVATVVNGMKEAGNHTINFEGSKLASGVYLYQLNAGSYQDVKKMILMK